jgi:hypothetical protein
MFSPSPLGRGLSLRGEYPLKTDVLRRWHVESSLRKMNDDILTFLG